MNLPRVVLVLLVVTTSLTAACGDEAEEPPAETTTQQLCDAPGDFDGQHLVVEDVVVETRSIQTTAGCPTDEGCCNAVWTSFVLECPDDDGDAIVLSVSPEAPFEAVWGEIVEEDQVIEDDPDGTEGLIEGSRTRLGCVGQECYEKCAPAEPEEIESVEGTFCTDDGCVGGDWDSDEGTFDAPHSFEFSLEVEDAEY